MSGRVSAPPADKQKTFREFLTVSLAIPASARCSIMRSNPSAFRSRDDHETKISRVFASTRGPNGCLLAS